ncbi:hypothetical protein AYI68_g1645 [Smittium mucronatum]|uniref:Uncharacterized protein n=1 Tax=Smittium mucronatum TaxID=133383 RepID=A0A1R0H4Y9_9FUNG|nr:hypothetical protein AYI68_g1645 [Smittium mucronatum]
MKVLLLAVIKTSVKPSVILEKAVDVSSFSFFQRSSSRGDNGHRVPEPGRPVASRQDPRRLRGTAKRHLVPAQTGQVLGRLPNATAGRRHHERADGTRRD